jgi:hypothetical protein
VKILSRRVAVLSGITAINAFFLSCGNHKLISLSVAPASITSAVGQSVQFHATGTYVMQSESRQRPASSQDVTNQVSWSSSNPAVATINASGLAQVVGPGSATVSASIGGLTTRASLSAGAPGGVGNLGALTAITVIPGSQSTLVLGEPAQYIAIGTMDNGGVTTSQDVTDLVKWFSSDQSIVTIDSSGLAVSVGAGGGSATITAMGTAGNGSVITGTATFTGCASPCGPVTLPALSVFDVGLGTGRVQGFDAANPSVMVIDCDPSVGSTAACTGYFPLNATIVLTATPGPNSSFGGWSANCTSPSPSSTTCSITMSTNEPVGAIFN